MLAKCDVDCLSGKELDIGLDTTEDGNAGGTETEIQDIVKGKQLSMISAPGNNANSSDEGQCRVLTR